MHFQASITVKAPRERVYAAYTDFESMPKWSGQLTKVRVAKRDGDTVQLEAVGLSGSKGRAATRVMRLVPPTRVESESETRFTKTKRAVLFDEAPEGTKVTAMADVELRGLWSKILTTKGQDEVEKSAMQELASFARYVEGLP